MNSRRLFLYLLGQLGIMSLARFLFQWLMKYSDTPAVDGTLFAAAYVGGVILAFRIFDGVTDPMAGALSDWWVRKGRTRQSLLWFAVLLPPIGLVLCFSSAVWMPEVTRWTLLITGLFVFFVGYTIYAIPYWSLVEDYGKYAAPDRRALSNMLGLGLIIATIIGFVISPLMIDGLGYRNSAVIYAVAALVCMIAPIYAAPAKARHAPAASADRVPVGEVFRSFLLAFRNRRFVALLALLAGSQMSFTVVTASAAFIAVHLIGGTEQHVSYLLGPLIVTAVPMFLFAPGLSARLGWEKALLWASVLLGVVYLVCSAAGVTIVHSPLVTAILLFSTAGPMVAVLLALEGEAITSCANENGTGAVSMYFGVYNLVIKCLNGVALLVTGILIDLSKGPWGAGAIRFMVIAAALMLFAGVAAALLLNMRSKRLATRGL
jgi:GPH family glycoside/pentoside/hexuronide:cation symporter